MQWAANSLLKPNSFSVAEPHGGALNAATARFGGAREEWTDCSTSINPWPYPTADLDPALWSRLPEPEQIYELEQVAAQCYGAPDANQVVAVPGSQALIQLLPRLLHPTTVNVLAPTYSEHTTAWHREGHDVSQCADVSSVSEAARVVVLTRPNNPDGSVVGADDVAWLHRTMQARDGLLVVDEAFADLVPVESLVGMVDDSHLLILRSLGKFYGLAGARVGLGIFGSEALAQSVREALGPWPLTTPSVHVATLALADKAWAAATRENLAAVAERTRVAFQEAGIPIVGQTDLFTLIRCDGETSFLALAREHVLVRSFRYDPQWIRIGVIPTRETLQRICGAVVRD
ncbi:MAG: threonine-phosphate decarboxylase [Chromatiales bacterium]|nr:threonine-phosphate decarboxylase [Chromatiales bacterium]